MINILIIESPVENAVTWWRFLRPLGEMQRQFPGRFNIRMVKRREIMADDLFFTDIFILSRASDSEALLLAKRIKDLGRSKIIYDLDDAITNLPAHHSQKAYHDNRIGIAREIFALTDWFWVTTEQLQYETDSMGRSEIIPNAIFPEDLPKEPAPDRGVWMWRGRDLQKEDVYLTGAYGYEEMKAHIKKMVFWGCLPSLDHTGIEISLREYEDDLVGYFKYLKTRPFNGIWKPLVPNQFNKAKSNIAWIEATMSGGVCLTNVAGVEGFEHWDFAVNKFPESYSEAVGRWETSCGEIISKYNLYNTARQRAESLERLLNSKTTLA